MTFGFGFCTGWGFGAVTAENRIRDEENDFESAATKRHSNVNIRLTEFTKNF
jgi:hypothetical protein